MTKSERRKARKLAHRKGKPLTGELAVDRGNEPFDFTESAAGYQARYKWARAYDDLNGAPEGDWDR